MILSASRRTDIPAFHFDWFLNRLREGWLLVRNPFDSTRLSRVPLGPSAVECIVFWTKNPEPMLGRLEELAPYPYYIQYTLNPYGRDLECRLPALSGRLDLFRALADRLGSERLVWRYSPVILTDTYSAAFHLDAFGGLARQLSGSTVRCALSFLDMYAAIAPRMRALGAGETACQDRAALARQLAELAAENGIGLSACGDPGLVSAGISPARCVDGDLIQRLTGKSMAFKKDSGQRGVCNCVESVDVGAYQTCRHGCVYCYANRSHAAALRRAAACDPRLPLLCGDLRPGDVVTERKVRLHALTGQQVPLQPQPNITASDPESP